MISSNPLDPKNSQSGNNNSFYDVGSRMQLEKLNQNTVEQSIAQFKKFRSQTSLNEESYIQNFHKNLAEISQFDGKLNDKQIKSIIKTLTMVFPQLESCEQAQRLLDSNPNFSSSLLKSFKVGSIFSQTEQGIVINVRARTNLTELSNCIKQLEKIFNRDVYIENSSATPLDIEFLSQHGEKIRTLNTKRYSINDEDFLNIVQKCHNINSLAISCEDITSNISEHLNSLENLKILDITSGDNITNLDLSKLENLESLTLTDFPQLTDLNFGLLQKLKKLDLAHFACLESLDLSQLKNLSVVKLSSFDTLATLDLGQDTALTDLEITGFPALERLYISQLPNLAAFKIINLKNLKTLDLNKLPNLIDPRILVDNLTTLNMSQLSKLVWREFPPWCKTLNQLNLSQLPNLEKLNLGDYRNLSDLNLSQLKNLKNINFPRGALTQLNLEQLNLKTLDLPHSRKLENVTLKLPMLKEIRLEHSYALKNLDLSDCLSLEKLDISYCQNLTALTLSNFAKLNLIDMPETYNLNKKSRMQILYLQLINVILWDITGGVNLAQVKEIKEQELLPYALSKIEEVKESNKHLFSNKFQPTEEEILILSQPVLWLSQQGLLPAIQLFARRDLRSSLGYAAMGLAWGQESELTETNKFLAERHLPWQKLARAMLLKLENEGVSSKTIETFRHGIEQSTRIFDNPTYAPILIEMLLQLIEKKEFSSLERQTILEKILLEVEDVAYRSAQAKIELHGKEALERWNGMAIYLTNLIEEVPLDLEKKTSLQIQIPPLIDSEDLKQVVDLDAAELRKIINLLEASKDPQWYVNKLQKIIKNSSFEPAERERLLQKMNANPDSYNSVVNELEEMQKGITQELNMVLNISKLRS